MKYDDILRMGFIDDVKETVMAELPENHQTALFSAAMLADDPSYYREAIL